MEACISSLLKRVSGYFIVASAFLVLAVFLLGLRAAATISEGYQAQGKILPNAAVSLNNRTLSLANADNRQYLYGVVVNPVDVSINLNPDSTTAQIVTSGVTEVAVSDINGEIKAGDQLTSSPIEGFVMKATTAGKILGVAQQDFSSRSAGAIAQTVVAKDGQKNQIATGLIQIQVGVNDYRAGTNASAPAAVAAIQNLLGDVAGKEVSVVRTVLAIGVLVIGLAASLIILYSAASGGIRSIGRNPLARNPVLLGLVQVIAIVVVILLVSGGIVFVIIRG